MIEADRKLREKLRAETEKAAGSPANNMFGSRISSSGSPVNMLEGDVLEQPSGMGMGMGMQLGMELSKPANPLSQTKVKSYEEAFAKIEDATGLSNVEDVVTKFLEAEDKNFSLFNYVNELNSEIERLELMIGETKGEIEKVSERRQLEICE